MSAGYDAEYVTGMSNKEIYLALQSITRQEAIDFIKHAKLMDYAFATPESRLQILEPVRAILTSSKEAERQTNLRMWSLSLERGKQELFNRSK